MTDRGEVVWEPSPDAFRLTQIAAFGRHCADTTGLDLTAFEALLAWSIGSPGEFWGAFAEWSGVRWHDEPSRSLVDRSMPGARWFPDGTLNYAEHAIAGAGDAVAIVSRSAESRTHATHL